jgi:hypothetical protein
MLKSLGELRRAIRSWLIVRGIKNVFLVDPLAASGAAADAKKAIGLMRDSVHMTKDGYTRLAKVCKETITAWLLGRKRKAVESHGADAKKPRIDRAGPSGGNAAGKGGQSGRGKKADAGRAGPAQKGRK